MYFLDQKDMATHWYNIQADLPEPLPPVLHPATGQPVKVRLLNTLAKSLREQMRDSSLEYRSIETDWITHSE